MIKGLDVRLVIYKDDDTDLTYDEFEAMIEENGLHMGGSVYPVDEEGERIDETP